MAIRGCYRDAAGKMRCVASVSDENDAFLTKRPCGGLGSLRRDAWRRMRWFGRSCPKRHGALCRFLVGTHDKARSECAPCQTCVKRMVGYIRPPRQETDRQRIQKRYPRCTQRIRQGSRASSGLTRSPSVAGSSPAWPTVSNLSRRGRIRARTTRRRGA